MSTEILSRKIAILPLSTLKERPGNPRTHDRRQKRAMIASIKRFGFTNPVLIDPDGVIIAGHARVDAAREIGLKGVPTICLSHLTPAELDAYVIADNRTAELSDWDKELLALSIAKIGEIDPDFDISITGFDLEEIELLADASTSRQAIDEEQEGELVPPANPISKPGDLWEIGGEHRLLCGDATARQSYQTLLDRERVDLVITDPPFNVPIAGHVSGLGQHRHREFVMASGEMTPSAFRRFLMSAISQFVAFSRSGSVHYIFADWRMIRELLDLGDGLYSELLNLAVWNKGNGGMGSFLRSQHELIAIFRNGRRRHLNNVALGANGRHRTNVWSYPGANSFGNGRTKDLALHPTVKPIAMIADAIMDASNRGDLVLDAFGGSGTTLLACHKAGRRARLIELDPAYVDVILRRASDQGLECRHTYSGRTFDQAAADRGMPA